jgi:superoxide dismutase, Fe-Mn family
MDGALPVPPNDLYKRLGTASAPVLLDVRGQESFSADDRLIIDQSEPGTALQEALARDFGSYDRWRAEFMAIGKALGGGSGWVLLAWSPRDGKLVNQWASDHCHTLAGGTPILALDMYEHSYHLDFGAEAATYVDTFMDAIRWASAERRFDQLSRV